MKKYLLLYIEFFLTEFRWYRKRKGGAWYKVTDGFDDSGMAGAVTYWKREVPPHWIATEEENYP